MVNKCIFVGRLTRNPETRRTDSAMAVTKFSLACDSGWGEKKRTEFIRCVSFSKLAEVIEQYLVKGSLIYIDGIQQTRDWTDDNGVKRFSTEIVVETMKMLDSRKSTNNESNPDYSGGGDDKDVPF